MRKMPISKIAELFSTITKEKTLYAPIEKGGQVNFEQWQPNSEVRLDVLNTVRSVKELFFPQSEDIVAFRTAGKKIEIMPEQEPDQPFVVFGVRACDVKSIEILDRVFLSDPVDTFYEARREMGTVVSLACNQPEETCFCSTFGIDAAQPAGDVEAYILGESLYLKALTQKGQELLELTGMLTEEAEEGEVEKAKEQIRQIIKKLPIGELDLEKFGGDALKELFDSPKWLEMSKACIACGTCTYVCPTCQCYDICDFDKGNGVQRFRCWDSCMYSDFTKMAHGNPRTTQKERFRQRFMHKLVYYPANNEGEFSCVGCGRCVAKCPISMNIVKVIKTLGAEGK